MAARTRAALITVCGERRRGIGEAVPPGSPAAAPLRLVQAGLRAHECRWAGEPPSRALAQWRFGSPILVYRCGGSVGIIRLPNAPTSRFIPRAIAVGTPEHTEPKLGSDYSDGPWNRQLNSFTPDAAKVTASPKIGEAVLAQLASRRLLGRCGRCRCIGRRGRCRRCIAGSCRGGCGGRR